MPKWDAYSSKGVQLSNSEVLLYLAQTCKCAKSLPNMWFMLLKTALFSIYISILHTGQQNRELLYHSLTNITKIKSQICRAFRRQVQLGNKSSQNKFAYNAMKGKRKTRTTDYLSRPRIYFLQATARIWVNTNHYQGGILFQDPYHSNTTLE